MFYYPIVWHNKIINLCFSTTTFLPFYIILALPNDGCSYQPKQVVVNVINEYTIIYSVVLFRESINQQ